METEDNGAVFDLIFLDIYMGGITGMDTAKELRQLGASAPVIFLTTSPDFAVESYEVNAAGYLLKPIQLEKLSALISHLLTSVERPRVCIQSGRRRRYVFLDDILFAESDNHSLERSCPARKSSATWPPGWTAASSAAIRAIWLTWPMWPTWWRTSS